MHTRPDIRVGDCLDLLRAMPDASVHCAITSPPYWGLRDYGHDGQIGLEPSLPEFIGRLVDVFGEVRRVLRDDGTLWVNMGDSYATRPNAGAGWDSSTLTKPNGRARKVQVAQEASMRSGRDFAGLPMGNLLGQPWRLAFAMQDDGWVLRQEIIWHKPTPMPESVRNRCTKAHEQIFLLSKGPRYFYDAHAIGVEGTGQTPGNVKPVKGAGDDTMRTRGGLHSVEAKQTVNRRSIWKIASEPLAEPHFAAFPTRLPELCLLAGTSEHGVCSVCGAPYQRVTEREALKRERPNDLTKRTGAEGTGNHTPNTVAGVASRTIGWEPTCSCHLNQDVGQDVSIQPAVVLDPFSGSGSTGIAAIRHGRRYIGLELNPEYAEMSRRRIAREARPGLVQTDEAGDAPLFGAVGSTA